MKRRKNEMSVEEFRECFFILGADVLRTILEMVESGKVKRAEMKRRAGAMVNAQMVARRRALRTRPAVKALVHGGRMEEARQLAEAKGGK
jgi:hypothetical protein